MQMIKFISYKTFGIINVLLSPEFNADIIPAPQQHATLARQLKEQGCNDCNLLSYGWANVINGKVFNIINEYFHSYDDNVDNIIKNKIYIEWAFKQDNDGLSELGRSLNQEMR